MNVCAGEEDLLNSPVGKRPGFTGRCSVVIGCPQAATAPGGRVPEQHRLQEGGVWEEYIYMQPRWHIRALADYIDTPT